MIMKKEKLKGYESPTTDVLELRTEGIVCTSSIHSIIIESFTDDPETLDF